MKSAARILWSILTAVAVVGAAVPAEQAAAPQANAQAQTPAQAPAFKPEELEQIVAPIALYPDSLLAQIFMDGAGIAAALRLGAAAAQLGTAFIACPESGADAGYRTLLASDAANHTVMTRAISGRPARCLANEFTRLATGVTHRQVPAYPIAYDAGKALNAAAKATGETRFGAHWAGQGAPLARALPAAELIAALADELP